MQLRAAYRQAELVNQVERVIAGDADQIHIFREHQQHEDDQCHAHAYCGDARVDSGLGRFRVHNDMRLVPSTDAGQDDDGNEGDETKPGDAALTVGQDDERRE